MTRCVFGECQQGSFERYWKLSTYSNVFVYMLAKNNSLCSSCLLGEEGSQPLKSITKVSNVFRRCVFCHEASQLPFSLVQRVWKMRDNFSPDADISAIGVLWSKAVFSMCIFISVAFLKACKVQVEQSGCCIHATCSFHALVKISFLYAEKWNVVINRKHYQNKLTAPTTLRASIISQELGWTK